MALYKALRRFMGPNLSAVDFAALAPLSILLIGALVVLLIESIGGVHAKKGCFFTGLAVLVLALIATFAAPSSSHAMLTRWLRFDQAALFFQILFLAIGLSVLLLSHAFFMDSKAAEGEFLFLLLASVTGLIFISSSADFLLLFLGLETLSISLYVLCGYMKQWGLSAESAMKYFLNGAIAAAFLLYGIALIYGATGSTSYHALASFQQMAGSQQALFFAGIALVTLGLAFKAAIVPFHFWAPDVYAGASTPVTAFMAVGTKAGAFAALALLFIKFLPRFDLHWDQATSLLAIITLIYANLVAMRQQQLRRFFAYSGISHAGFLLIPIVAGTTEAFQSLAFYLVIYTAATLGAFAVLLFLDSAASRQEKGSAIPELRGLFHRSPWLAVILTLSLLTLAGIPPTAGFFAKFFVLKLAYQSGHYLLLVVGLLTTILAAYYYVRLVAEMFAAPSTETPQPAYSWPAGMVAGASFILLLLLSIYPALLLNGLDHLILAE